MARLLAALALLATACSAPPPALAPPPPPAGAARYRELLHAKAGLDAGPEELAGTARRDAARVEARMDRLARRIDPGAPGWRQVFARLRRDHPATDRAVLEAYRREAERAREFVVRRGLITVPPGPLSVIETPSFFPPGKYPLTAYLGYKLAVTTHRGGVERLDDHCRVCIPPLAVHETFPGHHVVFLLQHRPDPTADEATLDRAAASFKNRFFSEGWAQYAEILMLEQGYYAGEPERELGAWREILFRIDRAWIDADLHTGRLSPGRAARELAAAVLLDPETAREEIDKHLREPTMKASYYVGALQILELRAALEARVKPPARFDLRAFHDRLVRWTMPIPDVARLRFDVELPSGLPAGGLARYLAKIPEEPSETPGRLGAP
jgi:uncharacterized protein (DUF885 family)